LERETKIGANARIPQTAWEKIELEKVDMEIPKNSMVQTVDRAAPPQFPIGPDRFLGAALCFVGLFPLTGGILLLTSSRRPPT
jgi:hypothetical protein